MNVGNRHYNIQKYTKTVSSLLYHSYLYTYIDKNVFWNNIIDRTCICLYTLLYILEKRIKLVHRLISSL
jgi:hypothetical protein